MDNSAGNQPEAVAEKPVFGQFTLRGGTIHAARIRSVVLHTDLTKLTGKPHGEGATITLDREDVEGNPLPGPTVTVDDEFMRLNAVKSGGYLVETIEGEKYFLSDRDFAMIAVPAEVPVSAPVPGNDPNPQKKFPDDEGKNVDSPAGALGLADGTDQEPKGGE